MGYYLPGANIVKTQHSLIIHIAYWNPSTYSVFGSPYTRFDVILNDTSENSLDLLHSLQRMFVGSSNRPGLQRKDNCSTHFRGSACKAPNNNQSYSTHFTNVVRVYNWDWCRRRIIHASGTDDRRTLLLRANAMDTSPDTSLLETVHPTVIQEGVDISAVFTLSACCGCPSGCNGGATNFHCPLCPATKFKPNYKYRVTAHLKSHFAGSQGVVSVPGKSRGIFSSRQ